MIPYAIILCSVYCIKFAHFIIRDFSIPGALETTAQQNWLKQRARDYTLLVCTYLPVACLPATDFTIHKYPGTRVHSRDLPIIILVQVVAVCESITICFNAFVNRDRRLWPVERLVVAAFKWSLIQVSLYSHSILGNIPANVTLMSY